MRLQARGVARSGARRRSCRRGRRDVPEPPVAPTRYLGAATVSRERRLQRSGIAIPTETAVTRVSDVMTRGVRTLSPRDSIAAAAQAMERLDVGGVTVCAQDQLVGVVTARDIVVRGVARGRPADQTPLDEVMS